MYVQYVLCSCGSLGNDKVALSLAVTPDTCMTRDGRSSGEYQGGGKHVFYSERDGFSHVVNCSICCLYQITVFLQFH